ncbi:MAG: transposase [Treponema sp.]|nr:transposase [Treponema sp.]
MAERLWRYSPFHKQEKIRALFESAGVDARRLPPYSPDLNPIEKSFSKLKSILRKERMREAVGLDENQIREYIRNQEQWETGERASLNFGEDWNF